MQQSHLWQLGRWSNTQKIMEGWEWLISELKMRLFLKNLHKFFNKKDIPWVQLLWNRYYKNGKLPSGRKVGSFWWRRILNLLTQYKGIASAIKGNGESILFWEDTWNGKMLRYEYPELYSFAKQTNIRVAKVLMLNQFQDHFQLPLSEIAFNQFLEVEIWLHSMQQSEMADEWSYIWGSKDFSSNKIYRRFLGNNSVDPIYKWLWKTSCEQKHKVFFGYL